MPENIIVFRREIETLKVSESRIEKNRDMKVRHFHDSIELYILLEGTRYFFVDRTIHVIEEHTAILIPPGQIHKTSTYGDDPRHRRFLLQLSREGSEGILRDTFAMGFDEFCQALSGPVRISDEKWPEFLALMEKIKTAFSGETPYLPMVKLLAHELLFMYTEELGRIRAQKKESRDTAALPSDTLSSIQQVIEYLNDRYMEDIHLDDLARRFFISRAYLTRSFRQMTGVTVVQYLTVVRIRRACQLLTETDEPVTEIARQCGFSNTTYFENVFRRLRGMTPSRYRRRS